MKVFDTGETVIVRSDKFTNRSYEFRDHKKTLPNQRAQLAMEMAVRWGMVAAQPDGEDQTGRAKLRPLTPAETAQRATETADLLFSEMERRGWIVPLPSIEELYADGPERDK